MSRTISYNPGYVSGAIAIWTPPDGGYHAVVLLERLPRRDGWRVWSRGVHQVLEAKREDLEPLERIVKK